MCLHALGFPNRLNNAINVPRVYSFTLFVSLSNAKNN